MVHITPFWDVPDMMNLTKSVTLGLFCVSLSSMYMSMLKKQINTNDGMYVLMDIKNDELVVMIGRPWSSTMLIDY